MFKGFTKEFAEALAIYNQNSKDKFAFCASDLRYSSDFREGNYKYDILAPKIQSELGKIILAGGGTLSNPTGIDLTNIDGELSASVSRLEYGISYNVWVVINKKWLSESQRNNTSKIIKILFDGKYFEKINILTTSNLLEKFEKKTLFSAPPARQSLNREEKHKIEQAEKTSRIEHGQKILVARQKALQEIDQTLSECNLSIREAEIDWMDILPTSCQCEVKGIGSRENDELHKKHINYCLWREESEIINFKDNKMVPAIVSALERNEEKFGNYKKMVTQKIIKFASEKKGLNENQLETKMPNWKTLLLALRSKSKIDNYRKEAENCIENLSALENENNNNTSQTNEQTTNSDETENSGTENSSTTDNNNTTEEPKKEEPNNSNYSNQTNIQALKKQIASVIKNALSSPEPKLTNSDLDSEYQNWENKLNKLVEENKINVWKDKVLAHIEAQKKVKKISQKVDDDFNKTQDPNATIQDKKDALDELDKNEGEQAYEAKKEQIKETEKEVAQDNPNEYRDKLISSLDKKLAENGLNENDLDDKTKLEIKEFKNSTNLEPEKLVETKMRLFEKIGQTGAKKKVDNLAFEVEKVLKSKEKIQVEKLKKKLLEILNSQNVYYSAHKPRLKNLLKQLESTSVLNHNSLLPSNSWPLSAKIGIGVVIVLTIGFFVFLIWKGKRTDDHPCLKYRTRRG